MLHASLAGVRGLSEEPDQLEMAKDGADTGTLRGQNNGVPSLGTTRVSMKGLTKLNLHADFCECRGSC